MEGKIPRMYCIKVNSFQEQFEIIQKMSLMQHTHNKLARDFEILTEISKENINHEERLKPLIRACIKEFFSLVEGDLFLINQFLPYERFDDKESISIKFKKTFRHHSESFKKQNIKQEYQSKSYVKLYRLKIKRDQIVHPKSLVGIDVNINDFNNVVIVYQEYRNYIIQLMTNIGFSTQIPNSF